MAKHFEGIATVGPDGDAQIQIHETLPPGRHRVIVVVGEPAPEPLADFLARIEIRTAELPPDLHLGREDIYGEEGR